MTSIFISYSRKDSKFVSDLDKQLRDNGHETWIDFEGIRGGQQWAEEIEEALNGCKVIIVVLSPDSVDSEWVRKERFRARDLKRPIIPVMCRHTELPVDLADVHYINFMGPRHAAMKKLLAALVDPGKTRQAHTVHAVTAGNLEQVVKLRTLTGHTDQLISVQWSPDGAHLASGAKDGTVRLWDARTGQELCSREYAHQPYDMGLAWSPDGTHVGIAAYRNEINLWDVSNDVWSHTFEAKGVDLYNVAWSPDGTLLAGSGRRTNVLGDRVGSSIIMWTPTTGVEQWTIDLADEQHHDIMIVSSLAWAPDGMQLAYGWGPYINIINPRTSDQEARLPVPNDVYDVAWSPDGALLASVSQKHLVVWDVENGQWLHAPEASWPKSVDWSPDGTLLVSRTEETITIWDAAAGNVLHELGPTGRGDHVAWSPDGSYLAASSNNTIIIWGIGP